ncbi:Protein SAR DEFICIENT 1 [Ananas comosus]|uniref:Protein SAR DEFICIENT 1 n=1 Tax=Ananas comosus TaxID=4615 RepID=A0A199UEL7_ANACO|nr:Protein SAR DEFICIENT 1 [Ananas comosus]
MAAKRLHSDSDHHPADKTDDKRMRRLPSFSTVIREAMMRKSLQNFFFTLEPLLRKVVQEEVERVLVLHTPRMLERPQQKQIEAMESSSMKLIFKSQPFLPIFTGSKVEDAENSPLQILLAGTCSNGECCSPFSYPSPLKLELVALDGDFPPDGRENWTPAEFQKAILKERNGKRPLLTGDVNVILRDGIVMITELQFTDNSSWVRSRHFRIGVRVVPGSYDGPRIKEAMTQRFTVKDHRGELYRKHHPPYLGDEVWRLEKIGKDGAFHKKLALQHVNTVQDFLKLFEVDRHHLREILGAGMSDRMWEVTVNHAKECVLGDKIYVHRGPQCTLFLNPICQVVKIVFDDMSYDSTKELPRTQKNYVQQLVKRPTDNGTH